MAIFSREVTDANTRYTRYVKPILQYLKYPRGVKRSVLILGAQRSGTNMLAYAFQQLPICRVYSETEDLSRLDGDNKLRLDPLSQIRSRFRKTYAPVIVAKPLIESHRANELLEELPGARVIWMYRHFRDVAASDLKKFKNTAGRGNILPIIENELGNWRNDGVSSGVRETLRSIYREDLSPFECACLFWYARNRMAFEMGLDKNDKVTFVSYESIINKPKTTFARILERVDMPQLISGSATRHIKKNKNRQGGRNKVRTSILKLCEGLLNQLNRTPNHVRHTHRTNLNSYGLEEIKKQAAQVSVNEHLTRQAVKGKRPVVQGTSTPGKKTTLSDFSRPKHIPKKSAQRRRIDTYI